MTSALTELLNIESKSSTMLIEHMDRTSELIAEKKPTLKDFNEQQAQTVLPQREQKLSAMHPGATDPGDSSGEEESEDEDDPMPRRRKTQDCSKEAVTATKVPLQKAEGGGSDAVAPSPSAALHKPLPPIPVESARQASVADAPNADISIPVASSQPTQPPPPLPPRGNAAAPVDGAKALLDQQRLSGGEAGKQLQEQPDRKLEQLLPPQRDQQHQDEEQQQPERSRPPVPPRPASNSHAGAFS
jgi:hypothetical protein